MELYGNRRACSNPASIYPVLSLIFGALLWGLIWYPMRLLRDRGFSGVWLTLVLYGTALLASLPIVVREWPVIRTRYRALGLLAFGAGWTNVAFVLAVLHGNVVRVMLLFYLSPAWTLLLARLFLHERITWRALLTIGASVIGAAVLLWRPSVSGRGFVATSADWLAISAGIAFAASNVMTRRLSGVTLGAKSASVWIGVVFVCSVLLVATGMPVPRVTPMVVLSAMALGVAGILTMTYLVQFGVSHLPAQRSSVIMLTELIVGALSQYWLTGERMSSFAWVGGAAIVLSAYVAARPTGS